MVREVHRMRVLLVGDFNWNCLAASYQRAFEELGHEVLPFDVVTQRQSLVWWLRHRVGHRLTIHSLLARRLGSVEFNRRLL